MKTTPVSLLIRLRRSADEAAWDRFVRLYTPLLYHWARRLGVSQADAGDFLQDVFAVLVRELPRFDYQPQKRFRGWLWTVTLNKYREQHRRRAARPDEVDAGSMADVVEPDPVPQLDEAEYQKYLVDRALQLMQAEFQSATWKACWEFVVEQRPAAEVAAELGLSVNAVYLAKARVLRRLRQELAGLLD